MTDRPTAPIRPSRRRLLAGGTTALAGGTLLAQAVGAPPTQPSAAPAQDHQVPPELARRLRDTRNDAWRKKVAENEPLAAKLAEVERIDPDRPLPPGLPGRDYMPVITPDNISMPFKIVDGVKVFHMVAEEVLHEFMPGLKAHCWGYNGHVNGPTIEAVEGERIRIYLTNRLPAPTSLHPHGFILPNGMDGVSGLTNPVTFPGETFRIEWTVRQHGTFMYHSHHDTMTQEGMGLTGMFIVHPRRELHAPRELGPPVDRDFVILLQEWRLDVGAMRPNTLSMDFNLFTMNAKAFPGVSPLVARKGQRVRIRFGNLSAIDHHPMHLHGHEFAVTGENSFRVPPERQVLKATSLIPVGRTQDWELIALYPGDWIFHCHMTHHMMNQMDHQFPNLVGVSADDLDKHLRELLPNYMTMATGGMNDSTGRPDHPIPPNSAPMGFTDGPFGSAPLGGMTSVLKVREEISDEALARNEAPSWYRHPRGSVAVPASPEELRRDGIQA